MVIQDRMPERVRQVEFSETQRISTGLTRVVRASEVCCLFLEKGCVVVRELVEEGGKWVVKSVALPLNSGLVRTIHLEDEVLKEPERITEDEARKIVGAGFDSPAVHPGGLAEHDPMKPWAALADAVEKHWPSSLGVAGELSPSQVARQFPGIVAQGHPASCKCEGVGYRKIPAENGFTYEFCPGAPVAAAQSTEPAMADTPKAEEPPHHPHPQEQKVSTSEYVPANAEEAILNRRPRRR